MPVSKPASMAVIVALVIGACGSGSDGAAGGGKEEVVVFAAASLNGAFEEIAEGLEAEENGPDVLLSFDSSSSLAAQIVAGSPADIFASADLVQIGVVKDEGLVETSETFAINKLQIITPADNPAGIRSPDDLAKAGVSVVLAAEEVPVGNYARRFFDELGILGEVEANVVSNEQDVKDVLTKVRLGEADAGVVYVTDVTPEVASEVRAIDTPDLESARATYGIATLSEGPNPEGAELFFDRVLSEEGRKVLSGYGFEIP